jgi:hypothetical protein
LVAGSIPSESVFGEFRPLPIHRPAYDFLLVAGVALAGPPRPVNKVGKIRLRRHRCKKLELPLIGPRETLPSPERPLARRRFVDAAT